MWLRDHYYVDLELWRKWLLDNFAEPCYDSKSQTREDNMLRRGHDSPLITYGFLIGVELLDGGATTPEQIANRFADSISYMEDVGAVDVEELGRVNVYPEETEHDQD